MQFVFEHKKIIKIEENFIAKTPSLQAFEHTDLMQLNNQRVSITRFFTVQTPLDSLYIYNMIICIFA